LSKKDTKIVRRTTTATTTAATTTSVSTAAFGFQNFRTWSTFGDFETWVLFSIKASVSNTYRKLGSVLQIF